MSAKTDPGWEIVKPDPMGEPFILLVRSASKPGRWHRVKWWTDHNRETHVECDSGICERDMFKPSEECRHETEALRYLRGETLEAQLAKSIEQAKERTRA